MNNKVISCKEYPKKIELIGIEPEQIIKLKTLGIKIGEQVLIHPELLANLLNMPIGQNIKIGNNSRIGNCTFIGEVKIGQNCNIKDGVTIHNSELQRLVKVGENAVIEDATIYSGIKIGNEVSVANVTIKEHLLPNTSIIDGENLGGGVNKGIGYNHRRYHQEEE